MNDETQTPTMGMDGLADAAQAFAKFWADFTGKMAAAGFTMPAGGTPPESARQMQSAVLRALADACDEYLRSPQFQESMKQSLAASVQFRRQMNDWLGRMHHEFQGPSRQDIDQLMQVMERLERRTSDGFDRLSARIDALEQGRPRRRRPRKGAAPRRARS